MTARDPIIEQRSVELLSEADAAAGNRTGPRRLWAYGYGHIAELAGVDVRVARDAAAHGRFDPGDLGSVVAWAAERRASSLDPRQAADPAGARVLMEREASASAWPERIPTDHIRHVPGSTSASGRAVFTVTPDHKPPYTVSGHPTGCGSSDCDDGEGTV